MRALEFLGPLNWTFPALEKEETRETTKIEEVEKRERERASFFFPPPSTDRLLPLSQTATETAPSSSKEEEEFCFLPPRFFFPRAMTQVSVSLGLPPRPPKKELLSHDLELEDSDYSSGEDAGSPSSSSNNRSSRAGAGGGSAQPLSGVSADCEGPNWRASVQQFDNFLCRVHAQVRQNGERSSGRAEQKRGMLLFEGKNLVPFSPFLCTEGKKRNCFLRSSALPLPAAAQLLSSRQRRGDCHPRDAW